ncbi:alanyl-tRNA editing protein [Neobacillus ginsengisoli]|uniref:Alanyl-tRNA synthetase n=1 Tax=Neobacillus ginsengisoli TaxID=904295 RepID=A0ABT9XV59_9BACI|nr:DHHA1 domain-containing protein [Neobacillus ginsengisoli]MDQ0198839.1 alanyl-tRNA synthetase [Neobacillus ginsengisoli]
MENKLYYKDAYIKSFTGKVVKQEQDQAGNWYLVLQQTAFYPTGGGQPHDIGTIGDRRVLNVEEVDGEIRHYLESPLQEIGMEVTGVIDWQRRFDHMQQHTGQHILSAAFDHLFHYNTVSFHLGNELLTIDIETEMLTEEEAKRAEDLANKIILENRPIEIKWVKEEELSQYPLRKETKVKEDIRLVIIPDFDYNGCGGTHPKATGEVQVIKILDWEKQKKNIRVHFVCGNRVMIQLDQKQKVLLELTKRLNAPEKDMGQAVIRLLENGRQLEKSFEQARENLLHYEAEDLVGKSKKSGENIVTCIFQNRTIQELQRLARNVTALAEQSLVFLVSENEGRLQLVCARGADRAENMKNLIGSALRLINGKGGGNESFAQGGGEALISGQEMLQHLLEVIK